MGNRRFLLTAVAAAGFALAAGPALAHDAPPPPPMPMAGTPHEMMPPEAREAWLAECRDRLSHHRRREERLDRCEAYLYDYYAYYRGFQGRGAYGPAGAQPGYGHPSACCQPMMMVPIVRIAKPEPRCKETVEYEYVDVPVSAPPRSVRPRPAPDKRIKVVPDKRIPLK